MSNKLDEEVLSNIRSIRRLRDELSGFAGTLKSLNYKHLTSLFGDDIETIDKYQKKINELKGEIWRLRGETKKALAEAENDKTGSNMDEWINKAKEVESYLNKIRGRLNEVASISPSGLKKVVEESKRAVNFSDWHNIDFEFKGVEGALAKVQFYNSKLFEVPENSTAYFQLLELRSKAVKEYEKELEKEAEKEAEAERKKKEAIEQQHKEILDETRNYVKEWETLNGRPFEFKEFQGTHAKLVYYNTQLDKVPEGSKEYIKILELRRQMEQQLLAEVLQAEKDKANAVEDRRKAIENMLNEQAKKEKQLAVDKAKYQDDELAKIKKHVEIQEAITGKRFTYKGETGFSAEANYYDAQLRYFEKNSEQYIQVLRLKRKAEENAAKESEKLAQEQANAQIKAIQDTLKETQNYVKQQEILTGKRFEFNGKQGYKAETDYYSQQLSKFKEGTQEYIQVLALKRKAEENDAEELKRLTQEKTNTQIENQKKLLEETKNYVKEYKILNNSRFKFNGKEGYQAETDYYSQQLPKFKEGTQEYIQVLALKQQAEENATKESERLAQEQANAQIKAIEDTKNRISGILGTISKISQAINNAINKVISAIRSILSIVRTVFNTVTSIINGFKNTVSKIITLFGNLGNRVKSLFTGISSNSKSANDSVNILSGSFTELKSAVDLVSGAISKIFNNEFVNNALNLYQSIYSFKNIVGRELTQSTIDWGNSMEHVLGLSSRHMVSDLNELSGTIYGLQIAAEDVPVASENILMISRYLATMGAAGGDATAVMTKLQSALAGMPRSAYSLGLRLDVTQLNQYLKGLKALGGEYENISTSFSDLNTEAQSYVRYSYLIKQFTDKYDLKTFADALDTTTGRITQLKEAIYNMKTVIGQAVIEAFGKIANFVTYIVNFITAKVQQIAEFFHLDMDFSADTNSSSKAFESLGSSAEDTANKIEEVEKAATKANKSLFSFDKVTKLNNNSSSTSSSDSGADEFDYKKLFNSALDGLKDLEGQIKSLDEKIKEQIESWRESLQKFAVEKTGRIDFDLGFDWEQIKDNLKQVVNNIKSFFSKWGNFGIEIGLKLLDDINIGKIATKFSALLKKFTEVANTVSDVLIPAFRQLYDETLKPIVEWLGVKISDAIDFCILKLEEFETWFTDNEDDITEWITTTLPESIKALGQRIGEVFNALFKGETTPSDNDKWQTFLDILVNINSVGRSVAEIVGNLAKSFYTFAKDNILPWLIEQLDKFARWLETHKKDIEDILTTIGHFAWEGFKLFVDVVGKLVNYVVENPEAVVNMFKRLIALKVGSWFTNVAAGIGKAIIELKAIKEIGAISATLASGAEGAVAGAGAGISLGAIAGITAGIAALIAVITNLWQISEGFRDSFIKVGSDIKNAWDGFISSFKQIDESGNTTIPILDKLKDAFDNISKALEPIITAVGIIAGELLSGLISMLEPLVDLIAVTLTEALNVLAGLIDIIVGVFTGNKEKIASGLAVISEAIIEFILAIPGIIGKNIDAIITAVVQTVERLGEAFIDGFESGITEAWKGFTTFLSEKWESLVKSVKDFFGIHSPSTVFADIGKYLIEGLKDGIDNTFEGLIELAGQLMSGLVDKFRYAKEEAIRIWSNAKSEFEDIVNKISSVFDGIKTSISNAFSTAKDTVVGAWNSLSGNTRSVSLNTASTSRSVQLTEFAGFRASGGAIPRGSAVIANEGGNLEMIGKVPGGQSVAVNNQMITEAIRKAVEQGMSNAISKMSFNQGGGDIIIKNDGIAIYDEATLRTLKRKLAEID